MNPPPTPALALVKEVQSKLIHIAADLLKLRGMDVSDLGWLPVTTPKGTLRAVQRKFNEFDEAVCLHAIAVRDVADKLSALAPPDAIRAAEPAGYIYETDGPFGVHQSLRDEYYNGRKPDRVIPYYTAPPSGAALRDASPAQGWRLVPVKMTNAMINACIARLHTDPPTIWSAMLDAAPPPPAGEV